MVKRILRGLRYWLMQILAALMILWIFAVMNLSRFL